MNKQQNPLILIGCIGIVVLCLFGCFDIDVTRNIIRDVLDTTEDPDVSSVASANTRFGFKLLHDLRERDSGGNIFISPLSISIALTMTYNGAVGETERAMAEVLEIDALDLSTINHSNRALRNSLENPDPKVQISIANSIWSRQGVEFNADFLERNRFLARRLPRSILARRKRRESSTNGLIQTQMARLRKSLTELTHRHCFS